MKVLLAEDDAVARRLLGAYLEKWGYETLVAEDGNEAWSLFGRHEDIAMVVLDWMMPGLDGVALCKRIRAECRDRTVYLLLCTARNRVEDVVAGLDAGADDYVAKPLKGAELRARLRVGVRTLTLEAALHRRIRELNKALAHVKTLQGLLPICMHCKRIRNDGDTWQRIEDYLEDHADIAFSHGLCDACLETHYPEVKPEPA